MCRSSPAYIPSTPHQTWFQHGPHSVFGKRWTPLSNEKSADRHLESITWPLPETSLSSLVPHIRWRKMCSITSSKGMNHTEEGQQILESRVYFKRQLTRRFLACASPCDVRIRRCSTSNQGSRHLGWAYWFCTSAGNPRRRPDHDNGVRRNHLRYVFIHCTALPLPKSPSYSVSTRQWRLKQNYDSNER